jgi:hypothetical protein
MTNLHIFDSYMRESVERETLFEPGHIKVMRSRRAPVGKLHVKSGSIEVEASRSACAQRLQCGEAVIFIEPSEISDDVASGKARDE